MGKGKKLVSAINRNSICQFKLFAKYSSVVLPIIILFFNSTNWAREQVHEFSPSLIKRIITPNPELPEPFDAAKKQDLIQYPFIPGKLMEGLMLSLDQTKSIKKQMQERYGLNDYNVSYIPSQSDTWAKVGDHVSGVSPNCFLCHSSFINGQFVPGIGNTRVDLQKFLKELIFKDISKDLKALHPFLDKVKDIYKDPNGLSVQTFRDRSSLLYSVFEFMTDSKKQSLAAGHTNPWGFAEYLVNWRDDNMDYWKTTSLFDKKNGRGFETSEVVLDPMPWWQLKYKEYINWDGLMKKSSRVVVQASLSPGRTGEQIREMDGLFSYLYDEIHRMDSPVYPKVKDLNSDKIARGEKAFNKVCAECHGRHSENGVYYRDPKDFRDSNKGKYKDEIIHLDHLKTDSRRITGMNIPYINTVEQTWLGHYGSPQYEFRTRSVLKEYLNENSDENYQTAKDIRRLCTSKTDTECTNSLTQLMKSKVYGYQVPPLWGIWASAPYFHNGSVPNLRGVLFLEERPKRWQLIDDPAQTNAPYTSYNIDAPGLSVEVNLPPNLGGTKIYDTDYPGCSNKGHDILDWSQKPAVPFSNETKEDILEYLKTL